MRRFVVAIALTVGALNGDAHAQAAGRRQQQPPPRALLERQLGERMAAVVKTRLGLTDAQMTRLQRTNQRFEVQRRQLLQQERETRRALREELALGNAANEQRVAELTDRGIQIQRRRLDIIESEQRELAEFMTPVQRAKYFGIQEQMRRRVEEMRRRQQPPGGRGVIQPDR
jgi:periplasmic protein CpxP/Spy